MTFTKEQLQHIIETDHVQCGDASALARMALAGMEAEPVGVTDKSEIECLKRGEMANVMPPDYKGCDSGDSVYLYDGPHPLTTSDRAELENYRNAQQLVPDDGRDQFEEWFKFHHGDEHSIVMLQRANGGANYIDPYVDLAWISWKDSRAAMLHGKAEPVTTAYKLPFEQWLSQQNEPIDIDCGCVTTEAFYHWLRVAYSVGNSPVIPDGWMACSERMPEDAQWCAVSTEYGYYVQCWSHGQGWLGDDISIPNCDVTHWMPLPAAPQQELSADA